MGELPVFQLGALLAKDYPVRFLPCPARGTRSFIPGGWMDMEVSSLEVQEIVGKTEISFFVFKNTWKWGLFWQFLTSDCCLSWREKESYSCPGKGGPPEWRRLDSHQEVWRRHVWSRATGRLKVLFLDPLHPSWYQATRSPLVSWIWRLLGSHNNWRLVGVYWPF